MHIISYLCTMIHALIISFPLFVCTILSAELVVSLWRRYDRARAYLLLWSLTATVLYAMHYVFFSHAVAWLPLADSIYAACNLAVYPLYLIYIYELTDERPLRHRLMWTSGLMTVAILAAVVVGSLYQQMSPAETADFINVYLYRTSHKTLLGLAAVQSVVHNACRVLFAVSVLGTVIIGVLRIRRYNHFIATLYADAERRQLNGVGVILKLLLVISLLSMVVNILGRSYFADSEWLMLPSVAFSCLLFAIGQAGLHQRYSIRDVERDEAGGSYELAASPVILPVDVPSPQPQLLDSSNGECALTLKLRALVEGDHRFMQPDLKLDDLARQLGTNRTYLLRAIKQDLKMTFSEYINRQRISYATTLMAHHPDWSKAEIANRVGYSSLSTFYRNLSEFGS